MVSGSSSAIATAFDALVPSSRLSSRAFRIAVELDHPAYDCIYLALAETRQSRLITADKKLSRKTAGTPWAGLVTVLA